MNDRRRLHSYCYVVFTVNLAEHRSNHLLVKKQKVSMKVGGRAMQGAA